MRIDAPWLNDAASRPVMEMLTQAGFQALFVGGCVRGALLGVPVADLDIATDALPDRVMQLAEQAGLHAVPTGLDHGTVTVLSQQRPFEITTFRRDVATDGRHAQVSFTTEVGQDALRRDFKMNALYCDAQGQVVDPLNGLPDLRAGRVRFIQDARQRIKEDYLRILRFFRFTAWYGRAGLDAEGLAACAELADGLARIARERVGQEMLKLLAAPDPAPAMCSMQISGVLLSCLPGAQTQTLAPLVHLEQALDIAPDPLRRLAALGAPQAEALRLSKAQARHLRALDAAVGEGERGAAALGFVHGAEVARDALLIRAASMGQALTRPDLEAAAFGARQKCPVGASDLLPHYQGAALGDALRRARDIWLDANFELEKKIILSRLKG